MLCLLSSNDWILLYGHQAVNFFFFWFNKTFGLQKNIKTEIASIDFKTLDCHWLQLDLDLHSNLGAVGQISFFFLCYAAYNTTEAGESQKNLHSFGKWDGTYIHFSNVHLGV